MLIACECRRLAKKPRAAGAGTGLRHQLDLRLSFTRELVLPGASVTHFKIEHVLSQIVYPEYYIFVYRVFNMWYFLT